MKNPIPVPSKGTPLLASWGAHVANGINSLASMSSPGMLARDGVTGTGAQILPTNKRERSASGIQPRQFTLRARLETRLSGNTTEYRTVVEFYNFYPHEAVTWSGHKIPSQSVIVNGWNECLTSEWSTSALPATTIYLNVRIDIDQNWQGTQVLPPKNTSVWNVSSTPIEARYLVGVNSPHITHAYELGIVTSGFVRQITDGSFNFMDLAIFEGRGGGSGSEGDADGTNYPMPFQYKRTDTENPSTGEITSSWAIVNNRFYWDGVEKTLPDYTPSGTCTVYLVCTLSSPSSNWTFSISETEGTASSGGKVINYKLYSFSNHVVTMDYRTTFMSISSPHEKARFSVKKPNGGTQEVTIDASGQSESSIEIRDSGSKSVTISTASLSSGDAVTFHTLTVNHADGTEDSYKVLASEDITVNESEAPEISGTVLKDVTIAYDASSRQLTYTKTTIDLETGEETQGEPQVIFTAVSHSGNS